MSVDVLLKRLRDDVDSRAREIDAAIKAERAQMGPLLDVIARSEGGRGFRQMKPYTTPATWCITISIPGSEGWRSPEQATATLDAYAAADIAIRVENEAAEKHNAEIVEAAIRFCKMLGFPIEQRYTTGKGRKERSHTGPAAWIQTLRSAAPRDTQWSEVQSRNGAFRGVIRDWQRKIDEGNEDARRRREAQEIERARIEAEARRLAAQMAAEAAGATPAVVALATVPPLVERVRATVSGPAPGTVGGIVPEGERLEIE